MKLSKEVLLKWAAEQRDKFVPAPRLPHLMPDLNTPEKQAEFRARCEAMSAELRAKLPPQERGEAA